MKDEKKPSAKDWRDSRKQRPLEDTALLGRPSAGTAEAVWALLAPSLDLRPEDLRPPFMNHCNLRREEERELALVAKRALLVALDICVAAARDRRTVVLNQIFDALADRWSARFRAVRQTSGADRVYDMSLETAKVCRRELLYEGIWLKAIWRIAGSSNPLYRAMRIPKAKGGYRLRPPADRMALAEFERLLSADSTYRRPPAGRRQLLLADESAPPIKTRQEVGAERPYNVVVVGPRAEKLIAGLEQTRLHFDVTAFKRDYKRHGRLLHKLSRWKQKVPWERRGAFRRRVRLGARARTHRDQYGRVYGQLRTGKPRGLLEIGNVVVLIKSRFFRAINRRFHAAHFWPECVSGKLDQMDRWESLARHLRRRVREKTSPRDRWFGFPDPHYGFEGARLDGRVLLADADPRHPLGAR